MGGTVADRQAFEATVRAAIASTKFFEAVTPEVVYPNVNPLRMDYVRKATNGVGLLTIDVFCEEVRVGATSSFTSSSTGSTSTATVGSSPSSTQGTIRFRDTPSTSSIVQPQSPSASPQINAGVVQPAMPTQEQQAAVSSVLSQSMLPF